NPADSRRAGFVAISACGVIAVFVVGFRSPPLSNPRSEIPPGSASHPETPARTRSPARSSGARWRTTSFPRHKYSWSFQYVSVRALLWLIQSEIFALSSTLAPRTFASGYRGEQLSVRFGPAAKRLGLHGIPPYTFCRGYRHSANWNA